MSGGDHPCAYAADLAAAFPEDAERIAQSMIRSYRRSGDFERLALWERVRERLRSHAY